MNDKPNNPFKRAAMFSIAVAVTALIWGAVNWAYARAWIRIHGAPPPNPGHAGPVTVEQPKPPAAEPVAPHQGAEPFLHRKKT